jgi:hypothetical protein
MLRISVPLGMPVIDGTPRRRYVYSHSAALGSRRLVICARLLDAKRQASRNGAGGGSNQ